MSADGIFNKPLIPLRVWALRRIGETDIKKIENHYNSFGKDNPDFQHILGLIYFKNNKYKEAVETLKSAIINYKNAEGYMIQNNELLNNAINIYQHYQDDIKDCFEKEGIYSS